jgi:DUF2075 family protein
MEEIHYCPNSITEIGCNTAQGLELNYVVVIGEDFFIRDGIVITEVLPAFQKR